MDKSIWYSKTCVMGIINVTPDSFSGDGFGINFDSAISQAVQFVKDGADIIDVGGESTRPPNLYKNVKEISVSEEIERVIPVIEGIRSQSDVCVSIDTSKSEVAIEAIRAGATIVNDIWGLKKDSKLVKVIADNNVCVVIMHNALSDTYSDVVTDTINDLKQSIDFAENNGVERSKIIVDPGFGFAKNLNHNLEIIRRLSEYKLLKSPILIGPSRKSTIGKILDLPVEDRLEGTSALVAVSIYNGANIVRVHDVRNMVRVAKMTDALVHGFKKS